MNTVLVLPRQAPLFLKRDVAFFAYIRVWLFSKFLVLHSSWERVFNTCRTLILYLRCCTLTCNSPSGKTPPSAFYRWENRSSERFRSLPQATAGEEMPWAETIWILRLCSLHYAQVILRARIWRIVRGLGSCQFPHLRTCEPGRKLIKHHIRKVLFSTSRYYWEYNPLLWLNYFSCLFPILFFFGCTLRHVES